MVLQAKDKKTFQSQFDQDILPRLDSTVRQSKAAGFLRTYIGIVHDWLSGSLQPPAEGSHYLENLVFHVYTTIIQPAVIDKGSSYVKKRLDAAQDALDSYLFD